MLISGGLLDQLLCGDDRVLRDKWAPMPIAGASLVALRWLEAFVW